MSAEDPYARSRELAARAAGFADMDDAAKVEFSQTELGACAALLDDLLTRFAALRTEVTDPDGRVRFTLGNDGRLLELFIDEQIGQQMDNLALESLLTRLFTAGNAAVAASLDELGGEDLPW
jgi:hypothetical protein